MPSCWTSWPAAPCSRSATPGSTARRRRRSAHAMRYRLERDVPPRCVVTADPIRLEQVLSNLLDNAVKYSPAGGLMRVGVACQATEAVVSIRDEGIGVPPDALEAIFEPFGRARNA